MSDADFDVSPMNKDIDFKECSECINKKCTKKHCIICTNLCYLKCKYKKNNMENENTRDINDLKLQEENNNFNNNQVAGKLVIKQRLNYIKPEINREDDYDMCDLWK